MRWQVGLRSSCLFRCVIYLLVTVKTELHPSHQLSEDVLDVKTTPSLAHPLVVLCSGSVMLVKGDGTVCDPCHSRRSSKIHEGSGISLFKKHHL